MTEKSTQADLKKVLAKLYPEVDDAQRVVADAELDATHITFKEKAINNWFNILQEADKHDKVQAIIEIARDEYPENEELRQVTSSIEIDILPEQARQYLPPKLYNDLNLMRRPEPEIARECKEHLEALLQTVQTYCSSLILTDARPFPRNVQGWWCDATLLFADISGFTAMSERLSARGRAGAEEITRVVNEYFATMVDILRQNGGVLLKFGGDALLGMFACKAQGTMTAPQDTAHHATQAALDMQRAMAKFASTNTSAGEFDLQTKVGLHTGQVFTAHVGTASQMEYWATGEDVNRTASAEEAAGEGQVIVSETTHHYLTGWIGTTQLSIENSEEDTTRSSFYAVSTAQSYSRLESQPVSKEISTPGNVSEIAQRLDTLTPYLPKGLLPRLVYNPQSRRVEGEHRLIAVLFINVTGFSELASSQADALTETMQDYFVTMQSIVEQHGGTINKTDLYSSGDKLLAVFGAPVAHEDDVDQAARAAVALQAAVEQVNQRLADRCPQVVVCLRQRIGLSTGYAFSGNVGSEIRQEYTIMGDEVNLAARLMSAARWDEILVSKHAFDLLEPFGEFEFFDELELKGKQEPISTYRLVDMGPTLRPKPPFVDRDSEYQMLQDALDRVLVGQGQIVSLTGEPGIGKSRLLSELRTNIESRSVLWLTGSCREQQTTYHIIADLLGDYLKLESSQDPHMQRDILSQAIERLFGPGHIDKLGPFLALSMNISLTEEWKKHVGHLEDKLSQRLADEVARFWERLTEDKPVALICENLHWLDSGSAEILLKIMEMVERVPILLCFTLRPGQYPASWQVVGAATTRFYDWHEQLRLDPLAPEHTAQLVEAILGPPVETEFQTRAYERSRGNPMFAAEIAHVATVTMREVAIPMSVEKIVESRADELPEGLRKTVKVAAVVGTQFTVPELQYMLPKPEQDILSDLARLRVMRLVDVVDIKQRIYSFVNPLTWEVLYNYQDRTSLSVAHSQLGQYWAEQGNPQKSAYHYLKGGSWKKALTQSERAADEHLETYAYAEALRLYEQALKAAKELGDLTAQSRLHHQTGKVNFEIGSYEQAEQAHKRELGLLLQQSADSLAQARAHCALGRVYDRWSKFELALDEVERGLKLAEDASVTRVQLLNVQCSVLRDMGKLGEAERAGKEALQTARDLGAGFEEAVACNCLGVVYGMQRDLEQALEYHRKSLSIRQELDLTYEITESLVNLGVGSGILSYLKRGDEKLEEAEELLNDAEEYLNRALRIRERIDDRYGLGSVYHNLGRVYLERGQVETAEEKFVQAMDLWRQVDYPKGIAFVYNDLGGEVYTAQERWDEARAHLEQSAQIYKSIGADTYLWGNYMTLVDVYRNLGQLPDALKAAQEALRWALNPKQEQRAKVLLQELRSSS